MGVAGMASTCPLAEVPIPAGGKESGVAEASQKNGLRGATTPARELTSNGLQRQLEGALSTVQGVLPILLRGNADAVTIAVDEGRQRVVRRDRQGSRGNHLL